MVKDVTILLLTNKFVLCSHARMTWPIMYNRFG